MQNTFIFIEVWFYSKGVHLILVKTAVALPSQLGIYLFIFATDQKKISFLATRGGLYKNTL